jgi:hypothetical protein
MHVLDGPQLYVMGVWNHFDADGNLTDPSIRDQIGKLLAALAEWTRRLRGH